MRPDGLVQGLVTGNVHTDILLPENIEACPEDELWKTIHPSELTNDQAIWSFNVSGVFSKIFLLIAAHLQATQLALFITRISTSLGAVS
jgi:hypothetical protein